MTDLTAIEGQNSILLTLFIMLAAANFWLRHLSVC